jgi:hypothetical protein
VTLPRVYGTIGLPDKATDFIALWCHTVAFASHSGCQGHVSIDRGLAPGKATPGSGSLWQRLDWQRTARHALPLGISLHADQGIRFFLCSKVILQVIEDVPVSHLRSLVAVQTTKSNSSIHKNVNNKQGVALLQNDHLAPEICS